MSEYEDFAPDLYYAITINEAGIITGRHEGAKPITAMQFYANPWLHGDIVHGIAKTSDYTEGTHINCYDETGKYKGNVWAIENGYTELPIGYEIVDGELVEVDRPIDESAPPTIRDRLNRLDAENDKDRRINTIVFRALAQTNVITTADVLDNAGMFPLWSDSIGQRADPGSYWRHGDKLYRVNDGQGHTIQADWPPDQAVSLFSLAANPADEWPEWIQPTGAHNAYANGAKVTHNGKRWVSTADGNVWAPGVYGWISQ